jgi:hypothetical protein
MIPPNVCSWQELPFKLSLRNGRIVPKPVDQVIATAP